MRRLAPLVLLAACSSAPPAATPVAPKRVWQTHLDEGHPLVGKIWSVRQGRFIEEKELLATLDGHVLLGEKHDNPDHHALQAEILRALVAKKPLVAFEMFDLESQAAIDESRRLAPRDAARLAAAVSWEKSGWPAWSGYAPVAQVALDADLPIIATGISRTRMRAAVKDGVPPLDTGEPLSAEDERSLTEELRSDHCGKLPESMLPRMIQIQRARDTSMARALAAAPNGVLIAGAGHTRRDRGVGHDLKQAWSIAFAEVEAQKTDPTSYASRWDTDKLPFDFVWFTPRLNDDDPCKGM